MPHYEAINEVVDEVVMHPFVSGSDVGLSIPYLTPAITRLADTVEDLTVFDAPLSDISRLSSLKKVKILDLSRTIVEDLSPLAALDKLEVLKLQQTEFDVGSLEALRDLPHLRHIRIFGGSRWDLVHKMDFWVAQSSSRKGIFGQINLQLSQADMMAWIADRQSMLQYVLKFGTLGSFGVYLGMDGRNGEYQIFLRSSNFKVPKSTA
jgi:hypothetical protein